jgi:large subunit ribosomal protein L23
MALNNIDKIQSLIYTEKSNRVLALGKYVFKVSKNSNKKEISSVISKIYNVKVESVNIINQKPKSKRFKGFNGIKSGYKKAIITVEKGKSINFE